MTPRPETAGRDAEPPGHASHEPRRLPPLLREATFHVSGVACPACARHAGRVLAAIPGVRSSRVLAAAEVAQVRFDLRRCSEHDIVAAARHAGFPLTPASGLPPSRRALGDPLRLAIALVLHANVVLLGLLARTSGAGSAQSRALEAAQLALAVPTVLGCGWPLLRAAARSCARRIPSSEIPVALAALGALGLAAAARPWPRVSVWAEAASAIVAFALVLRYAEATLRERAQAPLLRAAAQRGLLARKVLDDGREWLVPRERLSLGDRVRVLEGEMIPAEIRLDAGARLSRRRGDDRLELAAGDAAGAGRIVLSHEATGRVIRDGDDALSTSVEGEVQRTLARLDEDPDAPSFDAPWSGVAARALTIATATFAAFALLAEGMLGFGLGSTRTWSSTLAVLVAGAPLTLSAAATLATRIAVLRAHAAGLLVKHPGALARLAAVTRACLDRGGALTAGETHVTRLVWLGEEDPRLLADLFALERDSSHPTARAIRSFLRARDPALAALDGDEDAGRLAVVRAALGDGLSGAVNGRPVLVGSARHFDQAPALAAPVHAGLSWFGRDATPAGCIVHERVLSADARLLTRALLRRGVACEVLTGERPEAASACAAELGVPGAGGLLPLAKAMHIRDLQHAGERVLHVGDGGGDPVAAEHADVAAATLAGALPAVVAAPLVVVGASLVPLVHGVDIARALRRVVRQNHALLLGSHAVSLPLAAMGWLLPEQAAAVALATGMLVLANTARLLRAGAPKATDPATASPPSPPLLPDAPKP